MFLENSNWLSLVLNSIKSSHTELFFHWLFCTLSPLLQKCSVSVFSLTIIFPFIIARHSCHRCIYLVITIIFAVVACTITFFIKTCLLWAFCDHVIFRSTSKAFPRHAFHMSIGWKINRVSVFLFLSYPSETFSKEWLSPPKNVHSIWTACALSLSLPKPELLSIFM